MWRRWLVILAVIAIIVSGLFVIEVAYPPVGPHSPNQHAYNTNHKQGPGDDLLAVIGIILWSIVDLTESHHDLVIALGTLAIAAFTYTLWRATDRLWRTSQIHAGHMERSVGIAENSLVAVQRAFVSVPLVEVGAVLENQVVIGWRIFVVWENTGTTPTRHLVTNINIQTLETEMPDDFDYPDVTRRNIQRAFLPPRGTLRSGGGAGFIAIADLLRAASRRAHIYIYGWADYNDIFPDTERHRTEFCSELLILADPRVVDPHVMANSYALTFCRKYNGTDDECYRHPAPYIPEAPRPPLLDKAG